MQRKSSAQASSSVKVYDPHELKAIGDEMVRRGEIVPMPPGEVGECSATLGFLLRPGVNTVPQCDGMSLRERQVQLRTSEEMRKE